MQLIIYHPAASGVWADALFASVLQCSDNPSAGQVRKAIAAAVRASAAWGASSAWPRSSATTRRPR